MKGEFLPSERRGRTRAVLLIAVVVGTMLRCFRLGAHELSIDDRCRGPSRRSTTSGRVARAASAGLGQTPIYEIVQHGWMRLFGESETRCGALPALNRVAVNRVGVPRRPTKSCWRWARRHGSLIAASREDDVLRECPGRDMRLRVSAWCGKLLFAVGLRAIGLPRAGANVLDDAGVDSLVK